MQRYKYFLLHRYIYIFYQRQHHRHCSIAADEPIQTVKGKMKMKKQQKGLHCDKLLLILFAQNLNNHKINNGINYGRHLFGSKWLGKWIQLILNKKTEA